MIALLAVPLIDVILPGGVAPVLGVCVLLPLLVQLGLAAGCLLVLRPVIRTHSISIL